MAHHLASIFGTGTSYLLYLLSLLMTPAPKEQDRVNCSFYYKVRICAAAELLHINDIYHSGTLRSARVDTVTAALAST